jgi:hypothetical protein
MGDWIPVAPGIPQGRLIRVKSARARASAAWASVFLHALLLFLLLRTPGRDTVQAEAAAPMEVSLVAGPALAAAADAATQRPRASPHPVKVKPVTTPPDIVPQYVEADATAAPLPQRDSQNDPIAASVAAAAAAGNPCQLTQWLQDALTADPQVQAALPTIPRPDRSVANALNLWSAGWIAPPPKSTAGYGALRLALVSGIHAAPAACLDALVRGPELITLVEGGDTTVVAIGSGEWRWRDLLEPDDQMRLATSATATR